MRAAEPDDPVQSWHLGHMDFPTAWDQAPDGFVYLAACPAEPTPDDPPTNGRPSPLYRIELSAGIALERPYR